MLAREDTVDSHDRSPHRPRHQVAHPPIPGGWQPKLVDLGARRGQISFDSFEFGRHRTQLNRDGMELIAQPSHTFGRQGEFGRMGFGHEVGVVLGCEGRRRIGNLRVPLAPLSARPCLATPWVRCAAPTVADACRHARVGRRPWSPLSEQAPRRRTPGRREPSCPNPMHECDRGSRARARSGRTCAEPDPQDDLPSLARSARPG